MAMTRSLRNELSRYRRRKKGDSGVRPAEAHFNKSRRYGSSMPHAPRHAGYHHDLYGWGLAGDYRPSLHAPAVQVEQYDPYVPSQVRRALGPDIERSVHGRNNSTPEMPLPSSFSGDELTLIEQFLMAMGKKEEVGFEPPEGPRCSIHDPDRIIPFSCEPPLEAESEETPNNVARRFFDITEALGRLHDALPRDHPDIVNLRAAWEEMWDDSEAMSKVDSFPIERDLYFKATTLQEIAPEMFAGSEKGGVEE